MRATIPRAGLHLRRTRSCSRAQHRVIRKRISPSGSRKSAAGFHSPSFPQCPREADLERVRSSVHRRSTASNDCSVASVRWKNCSHRRACSSRCFPRAAVGKIKSAARSVDLKSLAHRLARCRFRFLKSSFPRDARSRPYKVARSSISLASGGWRRTSSNPWFGIGSCAPRPRAARLPNFMRTRIACVAHSYQAALMVSRTNSQPICD